MNDVLDHTVVALSDLDLSPPVEFRPTDEQSAIINEAVSSSDSILVSALAGAAKTTTLTLIAKALPKVPILSLAFNKRIAEEMKTRLPENTLSKTINSVGHSIWSNAIGKRRLIVNAKKSYELLRMKVDDLRGADKSDAYDKFSDTLRAISSAKMSGYIPDGMFPNIKRLITTQDFFDSLDEEVRYDLVDEVLLTSIKQAYDGTIDFDDQVYMSTLFGGQFPSFPLVLIDEAQDLSLMNHEFLSKLVTKRIIAVGDRNQSVYAFRGAATNSMDLLKQRFAMKEMELSISFRCPIEVVKLAQKRAPRMQWPEWAKPGTIRSPSEWSAHDIPENAAIVCRNNAPLFSCALRLLSLGRGVRLVGTDLGPQLIKTLKRLGPETLSREEVLVAITKWEADRLRKGRSAASTSDKADCLRVFAGFGENLSAAIAYAEHLFAAGGSISLMSIHKAKGLEFDSVYFLDPWRIPSKYAQSENELEQERNLNYVAVTRAKSELNFVNLEGLVE